MNWDDDEDDGEGYWGDSSKAVAIKWGVVGAVSNILSNDSYLGMVLVSLDIARITVSRC